MSLLVQTGTARHLCMNHRQQQYVLFKWSLTYVLKALILRDIPAERLASLLGGEGAGTFLLANLLRVPRLFNRV